MPAPRRYEKQARAAYVVVERNGVEDAGQNVGLAAANPTPTQRRTLRRSNARRQMPQPTDNDYESDDDYDRTSSTLRPTPTGPSIPRVTASPTNAALAENGPSPTVISLQPAASPQNDSGGISQNTEHLLIAAGSIGATIIIVMIILGIYTMRKRGLTFADVINNSKDTLRRRGGGPTTPPKFDMDKKVAYDDEWIYGGKDSYPQRAVSSSRSGSLSTQTPLKPLARSDSFKETTLERNDSMNRSFLLDSAPTRQPSHRRDISATPSSPVLPIQDTPRRSASTHNTRSVSDDDFPDPRQASAQPPPPSFRQFLSNRPSISQRPGQGGPMASRFSWTNSNAPQTPHDPSRDTVSQTVVGRDSFVTTRSSVPRFRTIDSWVNQQSTRVEEQRLKQQFRMTNSTTYSEEDSVPEMPAMPQNIRESSGLKGKNIKHQRHDTADTAPIFKAHPGTEVRFSTRSTVPSEVLDMGRRNAAL